MENNELVKKQARKAAYIVGIASFLGFSVFLFIPETYKNPFSLALIFLPIVFAPVGMLVGFILGRIIYFIFKRIKRKITYWIVLVLCVIFGPMTGILALVGIIRMVSSTEPYMNEIDTNRDGKIDKWVYDDPNKSTIRTEIDTDYDGIIDIKKYYKNADLTKMEYYKNGQLVKTIDIKNYHKKGSLIKKEYYEDKDLIKEYYDGNEGLIKTEYYKNGRLVKTEEFPKVKYIQE